MEPTDMSEALQDTNLSLTGSSFQDVNLSGSKIKNARLQKLERQDVDSSACLIVDPKLHGLEVRNCNLNGMQINGIAVTALFTAYSTK